jgi:hypothetical protein
MRCGMPRRGHCPEEKERRTEVEGNGCDMGGMEGSDGGAA